MNGNTWVGGHRVYEPCIILKPEMVKIAKTARVDGFCKIEGGKGVSIGEFVHIASFSHINIGGGETVFGDHSTCSSGCCVGSASPDWSYLYVSAAEPDEHRHVRYYRTIIGAYVMLGMGVIVLPGREVGEGAIVKPGSVVKGNVAPWTIVDGNPAIKVGNRIVTHKQVLEMKFERRHRLLFP